MKLDPGLREHLVHAAFHQHLERSGLASIGAEHFIYLAKQLSVRDSPTHDRSMRELSRFFSDSQLAALQSVLKTVVLPRPGVYATQLSESQHAFPEYFVYEKAMPTNNFFVKFYDGSDLAERLSSHFDVKLLTAQVPDELDVRVAFS